MNEKLFRELSVDQFDGKGFHPHQLICDEVRPTWPEYDIEQLFFEDKS
jgi:hypothetical protein